MARRARVSKRSAKAFAWAGNPSQLRRAQGPLPSFKQRPAGPVELWNEQDLAAAALASHSCTLAFR